MPNRNLHRLHSLLLKIGMIWRLCGILARRGVFFVLACVVMALIVAIEAVLPLSLFFRVGDRAGMMNGGSSFILTKDDLLRISTDFVAISRYAACYLPERPVCRNCC